MFKLEKTRSPPPAIVSNGNNTPLLGREGTASFSSPQPERKVRSPRFFAEEKSSHNKT